MKIARLAALVLVAAAFVPALACRAVIGYEDLSLGGASASSSHAESASKTSSGPGPGGAGGMPASTTSTCGMSSSTGAPMCHMADPHLCIKCCRDAYMAFNPILNGIVQKNCNVCSNQQCMMDCGTFCNGTGMAPMSCAPCVDDQILTCGAWKNACQMDCDCAQLLECINTC